MLKFFSKISPTSFYIFVAFLGEILFSFTTPPLQAPDEFNHFYRAYQISEGYFLPQQTNKRLGGEIPYAITDFVAPFVMASTVREYRPARNGRADSFENAVSDERCYKDFPNTSYYSPVSYLPQAFILFVLRKCDASAPTLYYGGRIASFLISLLAMVFVIRTIPVHKWLFTLLALLPMNLFIINSFSADNATTILSFLFISLVFKCAFDTKTITTRLLLYLFVVAALLALAKLVYVGLVLLIFIVPVNKFSSPKQRMVFITTLFLVSFALVYCWSGVVMQNYLLYQEYNPAYRDGPTLVPDANYYAQKAHILANGNYFFKVVISSIFNPEQTYLTSYIGKLGAFLDVPLPLWLIALSYLGILLVSVTEKNTFSFSIKQGVILFLSVVVCVVLLLLSQHLTWDPVGKGRVDLIQGRYLIPLFPLLFVLFGSFFHRFKFNVAFIVVPLILVLNGFAAWILHERYVYEPYNQQTTITCDLEEMDALGNFKTSFPDVILNGCSNQNYSEKRNGEASAVLSTNCEYCFTHVFKNFSSGDMIDVGAWVKGNAALILSGGKKGCGEFYNEFTDRHYTDKNGWTYLRGILVISQPCDSMTVAFYMQNKNNLPTYVDDITVSFKKKIPKN